MGDIATTDTPAPTHTSEELDALLMNVFVTPDGKREGGETIMKARHVGACPAGVKPGEDVE